MGKGIDKKEALKLVDESIKNGSAFEKFLKLIKYQGGRLYKVEIDAKKKRIRAYKNGKITAINALEIGKLSVSLDAGREKIDDKIDYNAGIELKHCVGDRVKRGDLLAVVYVNKDVKINNIKEIFKIN